MTPAEFDNPLFVSSGVRREAEKIGVRPPLTAMEQEYLRRLLKADEVDGFVNFARHPDAYEILKGLEGRGFLTVKWDGPQWFVWTTLAQRNAQALALRRWTP